MASSRWSGRYWQKAAWFARETEALPDKGFVKANQAMYPVHTMCRLLEVSASGYYAWLGRPPSQHSRSDTQLLVHIRQIHERSKATYGMPRVRAELAMQGILVGGKRVARLMREAGLRGVRRRWIITTQRQERNRPAPDLVQRRFHATEPNRLWVADATYIPTAAGFLYLTMVLDVFSRRIVGWGMADHLRTELMLAALDMALLATAPPMR
ncbi:IS3 family transposase [Undibacterium arcticum]